MYDDEELFDEVRSIYGVDPTSKKCVGTIPTLTAAKTHLERALNDKVQFDERKVIESSDWWYLPYIWIGCAGYIVDKNDGYITQLGSCHTLDDCFWAQNHGVKYKYADLTVLRVNDEEQTVGTLMGMGNRASINPIANKSDADRERVKYWTPDELKGQLDSLPVTFENQMLWFTIPALRHATENGFFEFQVAQGDWDAQFALT